MAAMIRINTLLSASLFLSLALLSGCKQSVDVPARIQAEDYQAFFDTTPGNEGGAYKSDDVDIEATTDSGGGYNVGWTDTGEYLRYEVNAQVGNYRATLRVATEQVDRTLRIKVDGVDVSGTLSVPDTGGWQTWRDITSEFALTGGSHTIEVYFDNGLVNLNWIDLSLVDDTTDPGNDWALVWQDEFNGSQIDTAKWEHEVNASGGGNNELQYYTARGENSYVSNGTLKIVARRETYTGPEGTRNYTSARLRTLNKGDWRNGRFEIRAKMPAGQGLWPAIWMLPTDWVYGGWAASGEIDIMEAVNLQAAGGNQVHGTLHYGGEWPDNVHSGQGMTPATSVVNHFHTYTVEWEPGEIRWYVDGQHYQTQTEWWSSAAPYPAPFNQRFHMILNVAVGGNWPGNPDGSSVFPQTMEVDYVRVYQRDEDSGSGNDDGSDSGTDDGGDDGAGGGSDDGGTDGGNDDGDTDSGNDDSSDDNPDANDDSYVPLYSAATPKEPAIVENTSAALITRFADRARDRHAREDQFQAYDHYLSFYWEHRTAAVEIIDTVGKGGDTITFNVTTQWKLSDNQAELRFFYRGLNTVAEYHNNGVMTPLDSLHYTRSVNRNGVTGEPLKVGDRMEFELSQFLDNAPNGRDNYYGTTYLYIVGQGLVPWETRGAFEDPNSEREDSFAIPQRGWLGGNTTLPYQYSNEPDNHFMQMATNLSSVNGQTFVLGRRVHHTDFADGSHNEAPENPDFHELANKLGRNYINHSCVSCHARNGRALPPAVGSELDQYVVRVGDAAGNPDSQLGAVLQPQTTSGTAEGGIRLSGWQAVGNLREPLYQFSGTNPAHYSVRIAPQLVGMGLLEAVPESALLNLADPGDTNGDGISGRLQIVADPQTGEPRIGRFGWKAGKASVRHQVAAALNTDMGVMNSLFPVPDCGAAQANCGAAGSEISNTHLDNLSAYVSLLGVRARRGLNDVTANRGETLFSDAGCAGCHTPTLPTSPHHPHAELRDQTIHPYTDLLLHDMGPGLADNLGEGRASGAEWRTPPLWGIGLTAGVSGGEAYLHDGRARTLDEAIRWHGGEGESAKQAYMGLSAADKNALIRFLQTL